MIVEYSIAMVLSSAQADKLGSNQNDIHTTQIHQVFEGALWSLTISIMVNLMDDKQLYEHQDQFYG